MSAQRSPQGVPDSRGLTWFEADPSYRGLLNLHLGPAPGRAPAAAFHRIGENWRAPNSMSWRWNPTNRLRHFLIPAL